MNPQQKPQEEPKHLQEEKILSFWKDKKILEKSKKQNEKGKAFYMMDGPPYATGHIHMGTALNKILKDIAMRSHRLQGEDVFDKAGYDTHGVPIEFQIEKEIGSTSKKDIEKFGVKKFIDKCKAFATQYIGVMDSEFKNLGVWMNFNNPYLTLNDSYIETIWDTFKTADEKKLLYLGKYPVHVCPRCETALAFNEIEYAKQEDNSIFVKFPVREKDSKNTFLVIFTTTPWTLPANTGVMVHPEYIYQQVSLSNGEKWILAKDLVPKIFSMLDTAYTLEKEFKGKEMKGWKYENPLAKNIELKTKNAYKVVLSARYVNTDEGTGLVHCAPGHGKEDYEVGKENDLDMPCPVGINGLLTEETGKYSGKKARVVDEEIIKDLEDSHSLVHKMKYSHDYPLCWRCKSSLLMLALPQWFLKISGIQKKLLEENEKTIWNPGWMKLRMKAWLEGISDWPVSRMRYWGTPLPIWVCEKCSEQKVIGSVEELKKLSGAKKISLHKPEIDEIFLKCRCKGKMKRVPEVLDVWFDSGVSSWAALDYMTDKKKFNKFWPADLNLEGKDQVRGWWNSEFILSEIKFSKKPFNNILVHGMILDIGKKKMSKSLGNIISPKDVIEKYSRDYLRYYFAKTSKGEDFSFDETDFLDIDKVFRILTNINNFVNQLQQSKAHSSIEDKWILSRLNSTIQEVTGYYNNYKFPEAVLTLENFLVKDLSKTYIQLTRERSEEIYDVVEEIYLSFLKLLAPIAPFITEKIWQELKTKKIVKEESIHLSFFPESDSKKINKKLEEEFEVAMKIIEAGLFQRDKIHIGLKWPLASAELSIKEKLSSDLIEVIARQINVKKIKLLSSELLSVKLDSAMTPSLEAEGFSRELARKIQSERKNLGLVKKDVVELKIKCSIELKKMFEENLMFIKERVNAKKIEFVEEDLPVNFEIKEKKIGIKIIVKK